VRLPDLDLSLGTATTFSRLVSATKGVTVEEAYAFTATIEASVTAIDPGMTATLSLSLSETFSKSVTVLSTGTVSDTYSFGSHIPGYQVRYSIWQLVDRFAIEGPTQGVPWTDPNYEVSDPAGQLVMEHPTGDLAAVTVWFWKN
jgi:hypothetical protein